MKFLVMMDIPAFVEIEAKDQADAERRAELLEVGGAEIVVKLRDTSDVEKFTGYLDSATVVNVEEKD